MRKLLLFLLLPCVSFAADQYGWFIGGYAGIGAYERSWADPDITTPNMLGTFGAKAGYSFKNNTDLFMDIGHWSSLQGFPDVFNSHDEDGYGFNAIWIKAEKRFYIK